MIGDNKTKNKSYKCKYKSCDKILDNKYYKEITKKSTNLFPAGVAIHYAHHQIYFSDSEGVIRVLDNQDNVADDSTTTSHSAAPPRIIHRSEQEPRAISVDWLHDYLYITERDQVSQHGQVCSRAQIMIKSNCYIYHVCLLMIKSL